MTQFAGILVPIIPGIMPLQSYGSFLRLTKLCGTRIPPQLQLDLDPLRVSGNGILKSSPCIMVGGRGIQHDDQKVKDFGVTLATEMIRRLVSEGNIPGVHFCTLNLERSVHKILRDLQWVSGSPKPKNKLISVRPIRLLKYLQSHSAIGCRRAVTRHCAKGPPN